MGHENAEGMAHVGVRVEPPVRLWRVGTVLNLHYFGLVGGKSIKLHFKHEVCEAMRNVFLFQGLREFFNVLFSVAVLEAT